VPISLHSVSMMYSNTITDIGVTRAAGYDGIELFLPKVFRYLDVGYSVDDLSAALGPLQVTMLDALMPVERRDPQFRAGMLSDCERAAAIAARLGCPAIQVVALDEFAATDRDGICREVVSSLCRLADVAAPYGVRLGLEPVSFSPFHALSDALAVIDRVGTDRAGLVLDTWHLWTSGTSWDEVARLDPSLIVCVQLGDSGVRQGTTWKNSDRTELPGDGVLPLRTAIDSVRATGYTGIWSAELLSPRHWEWEPQTLAAELLRRIQALLAS
jgi:sugar phosphate isomerase/epimerase